MKKVLIIGGGLSGLASAIFLNNEGYKVELIEATPKLGGRTYSFNYKGTEVDNGQHILMECYTNTLKYIDLIGARLHFDFQKNLAINSLNKKGESFKLETSRFIYPLNHLWGILNYKLFSLKERVLILRLLLKLKSIKVQKYENQTLLNFLIENNQTERIISLFWKGIAISTMNTELEEASASIFITVAKIIFFSDRNSANMIIPIKGLSEALIIPAREKLIRDGAKIYTSEKAINFVIEDKKVVAVETNKRTISEFDCIISALPEYGLRKVLDEIKIPKLKYSPIVSIHIWLSKNPLKESMYSLIDGEFDWLFNHGNYITLIKSSAKNLVTINKNIVIKIAFSELKKYFTILNNIEIKDYVVLKEKQATFISDLDSNKQRNSIFNPFSNLFIVGDWTSTELPATIEGAIKSSRDIVSKIKEF